MQYSKWLASGSMRAFVLLYLFGFIIVPAWLFGSSDQQNTEVSEYDLVETDIRNIILVGRSRVGKSTLIEVLKNKNYEPPLFNGLPQTTDASLHSFTIHSKSPNSNIQFNAIDTPDVFERITRDDNIVNITNEVNERIFDLILKCIDMNITIIHKVYFVMSFQTGLNQEDLKAFELFTYLFPGMEDKISILFSFAQGIPFEDSNLYLDQLREFPELKRIYESKSDIYMLGAAKASSTSMLSIKKLRQNVHAQRVKVLNHIIQQNVSFNVRDLLKTKVASLEYKLIEADVRNIIFVGRSRAGKSTLIEVLKNKNYVPHRFNVLRETIGASLTSFTMKSSSNSNVHFNIIDTPGVFERTNSTNDNDRRTNDVILEMILKCIDMEITKIHHVYFVMSIQTGLNPEDLEAFDLFTDMFVGMENKISIVVSFAQDVVSEEDYEHYLGQFRKVPELTRMNRRINESIYFLGAVKNGSSFNLRQNVFTQRTKLFDHIMQQRHSFSVKQLKVYREGQQLMKKVQNQLKRCCTEQEKGCDHQVMQRFDSFISHYEDEDECAVEHVEANSC